MLGVNAQMSKISLNYSIETLIHYICHCNNSWSQSVQIADMQPILPGPVMPDKVICPKCGEVYESSQFENITTQWYFCSTHEIWHHTDLCSMCDKPDTFHKGYLAGLHDAPKLMELPGE